MDKLIAYLKTAKWILWAILGVGATIVGIVLRSLVFGSKANDTEYEVPPAPSKIVEKVAAAKEEAQVAKIKATVEAAEDHEKLQTITKIEDPAERRKQLAEMLKTL